jgi:signal transduction histidine kinase
VNETIQIIRARVEKKGLTLQCQIAPEIPHLLLGDPGRIRQVLTNLCDNAIKFTSRGHVAVSVTCESLADAEVVQLSVSDTGVGIPIEKQQSVFEAFSQADTSTTRQFGGTGLGLTISARLVELMGGRIWVESEPVKGSTFHFTVRLPHVAKFGVKSADQGHQLTSPVQHEVADRPLKILLVEDHPVNQLLATTLLEG